MPAVMPTDLPELAPQRACPAGPAEIDSPGNRDRELATLLYNHVLKSLGASLAACVLGALHPGVPLQPQQEVLYKQYLRKHKVCGGASTSSLLGLVWPLCSLRVSVWRRGGVAALAGPTDGDVLNSNIQDTYPK